MIPRIKRVWYGDEPLFNGFHKGWLVKGKYGSDVCETLSKAIRYWLWHCGVPAKIAFWGVKSNE